jgi:hypothetical protein
MKTGSIHFARSAMLTEYLRYIWSRPAPTRIAVESTFLSHPLAVPIKTSTNRQSVLATDFNRRSVLEKPGQFGRLAGRGILNLLFIVFCLVIIGAQPAQAQTQCPEANLKYVQPPRTDGGYDVWDSGPWALADDFICTNTGPITDIHLWAGWKNDAIDLNTTFWLAIYDDVPAQTNGPVIIPSRPGTNILWQQYFGPGQYSQSQVPGGVAQFYNPEPPTPMGNDVKTYYYCFYPTNPPTQTGTPTQSKVYWLAVYAMPSQATSLLFGWKSAQFQQHDISTHTPWPGSAPLTTNWRPNYDLNNFGMDLAFKINTDTQCCPETNGTKFVQYPKVPGGMDVNASQNLTLADDFLCTNTGPVTDIHLWGSWLRDTIDPNVLFTLTIWSDVPKQTNGGTVIPSHPGIPLWSEPFGPGEYYQCRYTNLTEQFYDPSILGPLGFDTNVYYLCFYPRQPFPQQGTTAIPTNYWLSVNAQTSAAGQALFGWHTSYQFYNDVAVWGVGPAPAAWTPMTDPFGNPLSMAFKVTTPTNEPPPPPCCPETNGVKFAQQPRIPGGLDVNASRSPSTGQPLVLADDFRCTDTGPVTDIHLWGSWLRDSIDPNVLFTLSIWSDVPKKTNGTVVIPSHPGIQLWSEPFGPGEYYQCLYSNRVEQFFDPSIPAILGPDTNVYYLCFYPKNPFRQTGTAAAPTNYWLAVNAQTTAGNQQLFGWHTSYQYYNDDAVWGNGPVPAAWTPMADPQGLPLSMAFKVTTPTNPPCPTTFICPPNKTNECGTAWTFDDPRATNDCCGSNVTLIIIDTKTNGVCPQFITRNWLVTDCAGNTANCSQTVVIVDTTPPVFTFCPPSQTVECGTPWTFGTPTATDICCLHGISVLGTFTNTSLCPQIITRVWVADDCCGNTNVCSQTITIVDTTPPVFTLCPPNRTVECGSNWTFDTPIATDNCCLAAVTILGTFTNNPSCPLILTRVWVASDCCGNTNVCSQKITVVDTTPPVFTFCPPDRTVECGSTWEFGTPVAFDACCLQGVSILETITNGLCPQFITRTWLARDCCGLTNTCKQTITIVDTTPPTITCAPDKTVQCASNWTFDPPTATDRCCLNPVLKVLSTITNGICPQFITQTWAAYDCCNNSNVCSQTVTVIDTTPPTLTCSPDKTVECGTPWTFDPPKATDDCCTNPVVNTVLTYTNGTPCHYIASRIWIAFDCCQNQSLACTQRVSVVDTLPPRIFCPTNRVIDTCATNAVVTWPLVAIDDCSTNVTVTSTPPSGSVFARGTTTTVHVTATDGCGNTNTCDFTVTVERPALTIVHNPGLHTITLTWSDGILQVADNVLGPYVDVPLATSPYTVPAIGPHKFYRLRCP